MASLGLQGVIRGKLVRTTISDRRHGRMRSGSRTSVCRRKRR